MSRPVRPPPAAAALLHLFTPEGWPGASLAGDLEEEYRTRHATAPLRARAWYWRAVLQVVTAYGWERVRGRHPVSSGAAHGSASPRSPLGAHLLQDLRYALRSFRHTPGFTLVAAATLALGVGAATSVFSVADAVLLRPLPFPRPDRLVQVWTTRPDRGQFRAVTSGPAYLDWVRDARSFSGLAAYRTIDFNITGGDRPDRARGLSVTSNFFGVVGMTAALGRLPSPGDSDRGETSVVLSNALWHSVFAADPTILGRSIILNGEARTVVAILEPGNDFPEEMRLYAPSPYRVPIAPLESTDLSEEWGSGYLSVVGRLADGVSVKTANRDMAAVAARLSQDHPETHGMKSALVVPSLDDLVGNLRPTFFVILSAVGLLLLISCANVANLLTVRAVRRRRELAVRVAVGASLGRVRRQLLTESLALALLGGVPGFLLSLFGTRILIKLAPTDIPRLTAVNVDPRVLAFAVLATAVTGLVFGLAPMVGLGDQATSGILRSSRSGHGRGATERLRDGVVVIEFALSLLLVIGAGLMVRTFRAIDSVDPGFDPSNVLVAHVTLTGPRYEDDVALIDFYNQSLDRVRAIPGVESAGTVLTLPLRWAVRGTFGFAIQGRPGEEGRDLPVAYQVASPGYFAALRIPVLSGRDFEESDLTDAPFVAVVNEAAVDRYWPGEDVLGARVSAWGDPDDTETQWATVVGVVANTVKEGLDQDPEPELYIPMRQGVMNASTFVVRANRDPNGIAPDLRRAIAEVDPDIPLYGLSSMEDVLQSSMAQRRFRMLLIGVFAGTALLLAAVGLYGVISFTVGQRTREIGIRMALGAARDSVVAQVVAQGLARVGVGIALGLLASLVAQRAIESQVFGVSPSDPLTYVASATLFALVGVVACLVPAARAARVDPASSVRAE